MEFDKRMSDETIQFLNSALISNQKLLAEKDLNTKRKLLIANLLEANKSLQFENVKEIQYSIKNKDDNYTISFTCYKPDNCPQNAPITLYIHGGKLDNYYNY
jgi:dipeptidyl aminopeptidase/acylaminoacyl peptidase